ncbi:molybdate/tungstate transport system permease protein [Faunimonas pinastri]|uniref:Molybdate/tungstate transport system permease protein n=1 Tax=Faunimonas pinastri TaxID=1855383 RepID=A0A1H9E8Z4_9HYPH|nr:ABC transporter permease subunit [Faunimonas pinastri]SEQ22180.1 molybdate/tungstate transport system permease protein [Faunimonas pinastri]
MQTQQGEGRSSSPAASLVGALALILLLAPFVALASQTEWRTFGFAEGDLEAVRVSLLCSLASLALISLLGTPLAWWLARTQWRGRWLPDALLLLPLLSPPLAMGILLASFYGPYAPAGMLLQRAGISLSNSVPAFILAQCYGAGPYYVVAARAAFEGVPRPLEDVALTLGRTPREVFFSVTLPLARLGLIAGLAVAWVRALGEFGIVLIVAYYPQGIPVKLWVNLQDIGLTAVFPLLWLFFLVAMPLPLLLRFLARRRYGS